MSLSSPFEAVHQRMGANFSEYDGWRLPKEFGDPAAERAALEKRLVERALPALARQNFEVFCDEVGELQSRMGAYFAPLQGGAFTSPRVAAVVEGLAQEGVMGLGQSSWGPTGFAFAASEGAAETLLATARKLDRSSSLRFVVARGRNRGAEVLVQ